MACGKLDIHMQKMKLDLRLLREVQGKAYPPHVLGLFVSPSLTTSSEDVLWTWIQ